MAQNNDSELLGYEFHSDLEGVPAKYVGKNDTGSIEFDRNIPFEEEPGMDAFRARMRLAAHNEEVTLYIKSHRHKLYGRYHIKKVFRGNANAYRFNMNEPGSEIRGGKRKTRNTRKTRKTRKARRTRRNN